MLKKVIPFFVATFILVMLSSFYVKASDYQVPTLEKTQVETPIKKILEIKAPDISTPLPDREVESTENQIINQQKCQLIERKYKHYAHKEVQKDLLVSVGNAQMLHIDAAKSFKEMKKAAQKEGITLVAISGFRSIQQQKYLFHDVAKQRKQTEEERAKVSAPPGFSQHHTGFGIDINSVEVSFEKTKAFAWLQQHAGEYQFSLSFPKKNTQGVSYEPWHWAWHGNTLAKLALHDGCI
jgi:LAS superfamily LD-carboxypeptidase LdcB